jgi:predicted porin
MKKTLVALAALASVSAFAQVTLTGNLDVGLQMHDFKGNAVTTSAGSNGSSTTAIFFGGTEDLGSGLRAQFQYEIDPALTETGSKTAGTSATGTTSNVTSSLGNGQSFIALSGAFGRIAFGLPNSATLSINGDGNAGFGTAIGSGYRVTSFDAVRFQNSLRYDTPSFNGLSASYLTVNKNDKQGNTGITGLTGNQQNQTQGRDAVTEFGLAFVQGPIAVRYANLQTKQYAKQDVTTAAAAAGGAVLYPTWTANTGQAFTLKSFSAKYDIGSMGSVAMFSQKASSDTLSGISLATVAGRKFDRAATGFAGTYNVTPAIKLMANRQVVKIGDETGTSTTDSAQTTVTGFGVDYMLSKRSTIYYRTENDKDLAGVRSITGYTAATGNTTYTATAIGIRHTF